MDWIGLSAEEWTAVQAAAQGVANPWFIQRSRVLANWAAILEGGSEDVRADGVRGPGLARTGTGKPGPELYPGVHFRRTCPWI